MPFIPFTRGWEKVLNRRQWLIKKGPEDVTIIAIWSRGLRNVYDINAFASVFYAHKKD